MSYPLVRISSTVSGREHSADLWRGVLEKYAHDSEVGTYLPEDFKVQRSLSSAGAVLVGDNEWYAGEGAAGGSTLTVSTLEGRPDGILNIAQSTGTIHFGFELQKGPTTSIGAQVVFPNHPSQGRGAVVGECVVGGTITGTFFAGYTEKGITDFLSNAGALPADSDYVGVYRLGLAGDLRLVSHNDNAGSGTGWSSDQIILTSAQYLALVAGGPVKFGIRVNADNEIEVAINGRRIRATPTGVPLKNDLRAVPIEYTAPRICSLAGTAGVPATQSVQVDYFDTFIAN